MSSFMPNGLSAMAADRNRRGVGSLPSISSSSVCRADRNIAFLPSRLSTTSESATAAVRRVRGVGSCNGSGSCLLLSAMCECSMVECSMAVDRRERGVRPLVRSGSPVQYEGCSQFVDQLATGFHHFEKSRGSRGERRIRSGARPSRSNEGHDGGSVTLLSSTSSTDRSAAAASACLAFSAASIASSAARTAARTISWLCRNSSDAQRARCSPPSWTAASTRSSPRSACAEAQIITLPSSTTGVSAISAGVTEDESQSAGVGSGGRAWAAIAPACTCAITDWRYSFVGD